MMFCRSIFASFFFVVYPTLYDGRGQNPSTVVEGVDANIDPGYCGVSAVELVSRRFGKQALNGVHYERLLASPVSSFRDMRLALEANGFEAKSYEMELSDEGSWKWLGSLLEQGVVQVIIRLGHQKDAQVNWHFVVASDAKDGHILLIDPSTMSEASVTRQMLLKDRSKIQIQMVSLAKTSIAYWPMNTRETVYWTMLPLAALISLFRAKVRSKRLQAA